MEETGRHGWRVHLFTLIALLAVAAPVSAQLFQTHTEGNTIVVTIGAGLEGTVCCRGASIDEPGGGATCSQTCPANSEITQRFGCNSVGEHVVYGCVLDRSTNYQYVCEQQTIVVTEAPAPTCPQFDLITPGTKVLTHRYGDADEYPPGQTVDGEISLKIRVRAAPTGSEVYVKVTDPPDTAPYGAPHQKDDNADPDAGTVNGAKTTT